MENKAVECYYCDCNCSQCILKAAEDYYGLRISDDIYAMCKALCAGFGIGGFCNALVAGIMLFGFVADDSKAKRMRLMLLSEFEDRYHDFNCAKLKKERNGEYDCRELISFTARIIKEIIDKEMYGR